MEGSRFHKDNLRHLSRFSDLFVTLRILSAPPKTRESAKVHKQTNLIENRARRGTRSGVEGALLPPTHPQLEPLTLGPSFGNSEAPAGSFEPSLRYQMIPKGSNFQDSCSTSPRHLVVGNVEKCWNPGKVGGWVARAPFHPSRWIKRCVAGSTSPTGNVSS